MEPGKKAIEKLGGPAGKFYLTDLLVVKPNACHRPVVPILTPVIAQFNLSCILSQIISFSTVNSTNLNSKG